MQEFEVQRRGPNWRHTFGSCQHLVLTVTWWGWDCLREQRSSLTLQWLHCSRSGDENDQRRILGGNSQRAVWGMPRERVMPRSQMKETFQRGGSNHLCQMLLTAHNEDRKCTIGVSCLELMGDLCGEMKMKPGLEGVQKKTRRREGVDREYRQLLEWVLLWQQQRNGVASKGGWRTRKVCFILPWRYWNMLVCWWE